MNVYQACHVSKNVAFLYSTRQFNKSLDFVVLQAHGVASLVYVKRGGTQHGDMAAFTNGANGGRGGSL